MVTDMDQSIYNVESVELCKVPMLSFQGISYNHLGQNISSLSYTGIGHE